jgi:hypothetical protein
VSDGEHQERSDTAHAQPHVNVPEYYGHLSKKHLASEKRYDRVEKYTTFRVLGCGVPITRTTEVDGSGIYADSLMFREYYSSLPFGRFDPISVALRIEARELEERNGRTGR